VEDGPSPIIASILPPTKWGGGAERSEAEGGNPPKKSRSRRKPETTERARALRWVENSAEGLLWQELKGRRLGGHHFTRQFPIGPYFADFACRKAKLVRRDAFMRENGWSTLRFWNHDVLRHRTAVCGTILATLAGNLPATATAGELRFIYAPPVPSALARLAGVHA
jgi:very-short-patch-repair endonuclease